MRSYIYLGHAIRSCDRILLQDYVIRSRIVIMYRGHVTKSCIAVG